MARGMLRREITRLVDWYTHHGEANAPVGWREGGGGARAWMLCNAALPAHRPPPPAARPPALQASPSWCRACCSSTRCTCWTSSASHTSTGAGLLGHRGERLGKGLAWGLYQGVGRCTCWASSASPTFNRRALGCRKGWEGSLGRALTGCAGLARPNCQTQLPPRPAALPAPSCSPPALRRQPQGARVQPSADRHLCDQQVCPGWGRRAEACGSKCAQRARGGVRLRRLERSLTRALAGALAWALSACSALTSAAVEWARAAPSGPPPLATSLVHTLTPLSCPPNSSFLPQPRHPPTSGHPHRPAGP